METHQRPSQLAKYGMRYFTGIGKRLEPRFPMLDRSLRAANRTELPYVYLSTSVLKTLAISSASFVLGLLALASGVADGNALLEISLVLAPLYVAPLTFYGDLSQLQSAAKKRRKQFDEDLPYVITSMATLTKSGMRPEEIFGGVGRQPVFGELAKDCMRIYQDIHFLGKDLTHAIRDAARRSPSPTWEEFLEGSINTIASGGDLGAYLIQKAQTYSEDNARRLEAFLESISIMAEAYVVVAAAAPLFIIVMITVMLIMSDTFPAERMLIMLGVLGLPLLHGVFAYILKEVR